MLRYAPFALSLGLLVVLGQPAGACPFNKQANDAAQQFVNQQGPAAIQQVTPREVVPLRAAGGVKGAGAGFMGFGVLAMIGGMTIARQRP